MMQRFESFSLARATATKNEWAEEIHAWAAAGTIRAAVSDGGGSLTEINELKRIASTHTALTYDECEAGDRFGGYEVLYVAKGNGRRAHTLYLKREEEC